MAQDDQKWNLTLLSAREICKSSDIADASNTEVYLRNFLVVKNNVIHIDYNNFVDLESSVSLYGWFKHSKLSLGITNEMKKYFNCDLNKYSFNDALSAISDNIASSGYTQMENYWPTWYNRDPSPLSYTTLPICKNINVKSKSTYKVYKEKIIDNNNSNSNNNESKKVEKEECGIVIWACDGSGIVSIIDPNKSGDREKYVIKYEIKNLKIELVYIDLIELKQSKLIFKDIEMEMNSLLNIINKENSNINQISQKLNQILPQNKDCFDNIDIIENQMTGAKNNCERINDEISKMKQFLIDKDMKDDLNVKEKMRDINKKYLSLMESLLKIQSDLSNLVTKIDQLYNKEMNNLINDESKDNNDFSSKFDTNTQNILNKKLISLQFNNRLITNQTDLKNKIKAELLDTIKLVNNDQSALLTITATKQVIIETLKDTSKDLDYKMEQCQCFLQQMIRDILSNS